MFRHFFFSMLFIFMVTNSFATSFANYEPWTKFKENFPNSSCNFDSTSSLKIYGGDIFIGNDNINMDNFKEAGNKFILKWSDLLGITGSEARLYSANKFKYRYGLRYQQYYQGIKVDGATLVISFHPDGIITTFKSRFYRDINTSVTPTLSLSQAEIIALNYYFLDKSDYEESGELVIYGKYLSSNYKLCWKFGIADYNKNINSLFYVNAQDGKIEDIIDGANDTYSGTVNIISTISADNPTRTSKACNYFFIRQ